MDYAMMNKSAAVSIYQPAFLPSTTLMSTGGSIPTKPSTGSAHPGHIHIDRMQRFYHANLQK